MAHSVVGLEGKVGVVVGADLAMLPGPGLAGVWVVNRQAIHLFGGAITIEPQIAKSQAIVINVILACLLFPMN